MDLNALMRRIQQGDKEAFATLYTRYNKTVYRIAMEMTNDPAEAKSVVVAVFREMYQTIRAKGPYLGDLYAWLDALTAKQIRLRQLSAAQPASFSDSPENAFRPAIRRPQGGQETLQEDAPPADKPRIRAPEGEPQRGAKRRRYTEEEAAELEARVKSRLGDLEEEEEPRPKGEAVTTALLGLTALLLIWVLVGLLGSLDILPKWELGYAWFNQTFFSLF